MKYYKMVSGRGKVPMSENEIEQLFAQEQETILNEPSEFERLEKKVETISRTLEALSKTDVFRALLSLSEGSVEKDGTS